MGRPKRFLTLEQKKERELIRRNKQILKTSSLLRLEAKKEEAKKSVSPKRSISQPRKLNLKQLSNPSDANFEFCSDTLNLEDQYLKKTAAHTQTNRESTSKPLIKELKTDDSTIISRGNNRSSLRLIQ